MAKNKFRNPFNYAVESGELNNEPTQTVPNQSMTVKEMVEQYRRGIPMDAGKVPVYNGETELPDLANMDLAERQEYIEAVSEAYADAKTRIEFAKAQAKEKREIQDLEDAVERELEKRRKQSTPLKEG